MKLIYAIVLIAVTSVACKTDNKQAAGPKTRISIANDFINAFYSFNADSLKAILANAPGSQPEILYYQKWAECGHYEVKKRGKFVEKGEFTVTCPITVKDDLMAALKIDFNVTDTFDLTIEDGKITSVKTSSNDVEEYYSAKDWVNRERPGYVAKACEGIWAGGPTPCDCVQGMVKGFADYTAQKTK